MKNKAYMRSDIKAVLASLANNNNRFMMLVQDARTTAFAIGYMSAIMAVADAFAISHEDVIDMVIKEAKDATES